MLQLERKHFYALNRVCFDVLISEMEQRRTDNKLKVSLLGFNQAKMYTLAVAAAQLIPQFIYSSKNLTSDLCKKLTKEKLSIAVR